MTYPPLKEPRDRSGDEEPDTLDSITEDLRIALWAAPTLDAIVSAVDDASVRCAAIGEPTPEEPGSRYFRIQEGDGVCVEDDESEPVWAHNATHIVCGAWPELRVVTRERYREIDETTGRVCSACHGSGEGMSEYIACRRCRGTGSVPAGGHE